MLTARNCGWQEKSTIKIEYINKGVDEYAFDILLIQISFIIQDLVLISFTGNFLFFHFIHVSAIVLVLFRDVVSCLYSY